MSSQQCFFPNGVTADSRYVVCDPSAQQSTCCYQGESCLDSGLCLGPLGNIYRGACTDASWKTSACTSRCTDVKPGEEAWLKQCKWTGSAYNWACDADRWMASDSTPDPCSVNPQFNLKLGKVAQWNISGKVASAPTVTMSNSASPVTATVTVSAGTQGSITSPLTSTQFSAGTQASVAPQSTGVAATAVPSCSQDGGPVTAVSAGLGASLGTLLLLAIGSTIWYRRRWREEQKRTRNRPKMLPDAPSQTEHDMHAMKLGGSHVTVNELGGDEYHMLMDPRHKSVYMPELHAPLGAELASTNRC